MTETIKHFIRKPLPEWIKRYVKSIKDPSYKRGFLIGFRSLYH